MQLLDRGDLAMCLTAASLLLKRGHVQQAERILKTLLKQAEQIDDGGPLTGLVLIELHELYEYQGRNDEALPVWERIRKILLNGFESWQSAEY